MLTRTFDDVYPPELLAAREAKIRRFWAGEGARTLLSIHDNTCDYRQVDDDATIVERAVQQILASASLSEDYLPWFGPDFGTISTALPWGGAVVQPEGGKVFIKPVVHSSEEAERAQPGDAAGFHVARGGALSRQVKARLGTEAIRCHGVDLQGPLSTASLLWEQEDLFCSMLTEPEAVHRFLDRVTEFLIAMVHGMQAEMGPLCGMVWPYIWLPDDLGIVVTEDMMPLLSPALYQEFGLPYLKRLSDAFGGVFVHCCGAFEQHLPNMVESGVNYLGFDYFEPHTRTEAIYEALGSRCVYTIGLSPQGDGRWSSYEEFLAYLARVAPAEMRFWFCYDSAPEKAPGLTAMVRRHFPLE